MKGPLISGRTSNIQPRTPNIELLFLAAPRSEFDVRGSVFDIFHTFHRLIMLAFFSALCASAQDRTNQGPHIYRDQVEAHWFRGADGKTNQFWYRINVASNRYEFILVDAE